MHMHEDALIAGIIKGDRKAMEHLYDQYAPLLLGVAMRYCHRVDVAEDQVHESLLKILGNVKNFKPSFAGAFEAWMKRITVNQCLKMLRQQKDFRFTDAIPEQSTDAAEEHGGDLSEELIFSLKADELAAMMQELPVGYRTVLNLYVFEQMTHKEIAEELQISEGTSKTQLMKARLAMKHKLLCILKLKEVI